SLLRTEKISYWKNSNSASIEEVRSLIETNITLKQELFGVGIREIVNEIEKSIKKINEVETGVAIERTLSEIEKIINYVTVVKICIGQKTEGFDE
ncbi:20089_t:CDS:2, partial [Funneliformis geosporum]